MRRLALTLMTATLACAAPAGAVTARVGGVQVVVAPVVRADHAVHARVRALDESRTVEFKYWQASPPSTHPAAPVLIGKRTVVATGTARRVTIPARPLYPRISYLA